MVDALRRPALPKSAVILIMNLVFQVPLAVVLAILSFIIGFFPIVGSWSVYLPVAAWLLIFRDNPIGAAIMLVVGFLLNTLFISRKAADQVGLTELPVTRAEFNAVAEKMKAAGITPIANWRHQMGRRHEGRSRCPASASTPTARR